MSTGPLVILTLLAVTLVVGVIGVAAIRDTMQRTSELEATARGDLRTDRLGALRRRANARFRRSRLGRRLDLKLSGAAVDLGALDYAAVVGAAALGLAALSRGFLGTLGSLLLVVAVVASADRWLESRRRKRVQAFIGQLPDLARLLANATSAGLALRSGIDLVVRELPAPAGTEFAEVQRQMRLGHSLEGAISSLYRRLPSRDLDVLVRTLLIQSQAGGRLTTSLLNIAATLDDRRELERELKTSVSGAMFSGYTVLMIGVGAVLLMNVVSPGSLDALAGSLVGQVVLVTAAALFSLGMLLIRRITSVQI